MSLLQTIWFLLVGVLLTGYAVLDGFDLGVGMLHPFLAQTDLDRRILINSIGPVWDGNEVWLLTGGGALFAAFPKVYATVFSGFYLALMLVLAALIVRAVALEFRSKEAGARWRSFWDWAFAVSSWLASLLFGVALGNILRGVPLDAKGEFAGTFFSLLNPFSLLVGALSVTMFLLQGAAWVRLKAPDGLGERARSVSKAVWPLFFSLWLLATALSRLAAPGRWVNFRNPLPWSAVATVLLAAVLLRESLSRDASGRSFFLSSLMTAGLMGTAGFGLYPCLVPALGGGESLTIANSSSSQLTLKTMLILALVGMPIVIGYTIFIYRSLRGPVVIDEHSY